MAIFNGSGSNVAINMLSGAQFSFNSQDGASSTFYSWLTSDGSDLIAFGTGITFSGGVPTAGLINSMNLDFGNNGSNDATLTGLAGADLVTLAGGSISFLNEAFGGNDTITGSAFDDTLKGVAGDDVINGGAGNDTILGGSGNDTLNGGSGNDSLGGASGDDVFVASTGNDTYLGQTGNDEFQVRNFAGTSFDIDGGDGVDIITTTSTSAWTINLNTGTGSSGAATIVDIVDVENISGGSGNDILTGDNLDNELSGNAGNDTLNGLGGADTLDGGSGNDTLNGGSGNDILIGGTGSDIMNGSTGNDTFYNNGDGATNTVNGGSGIDTWSTQSAPGSGFSNSDWTINLATGTGTASNGTVVNNSSIENLLLGSGDDTVTGSTANNNIDVGNGANVVNAGDGNDTITGGTGVDDISGQNGNDIIIGGGGADDLDGNTGNDDFIFNAGTHNGDYNGGTDTDRLLIEGAGDFNFSSAAGLAAFEELQFNDSIGSATTRTVILRADDITGDMATLHVDGWTGAALDQIEIRMLTDTAVDLSGWTFQQFGDIGGEAEEYVTIIGDGSAETITGSIAQDNIQAGGGNDTIQGGAGNDIIDGGSGVDIIAGGDGDDVITGGTGNDQLTGGNGNDDFVFTAGNYNDDFITGNAGIDRVILDGSGTYNMYDVNMGFFAMEAIVFDNTGATTTTLQIGSSQIDSVSEFAAGTTVSGGNSGTMDNIEIFMGTDTTIDMSSWVFNSWESDDSVTFFGDASNEIITGTQVADTILGDGGNDTLSGDGGDDIIEGGAGNDTLNGGDGDDYLLGGSGTDSFNGGAGIDTLDYSANTGDAVVSNVSGTAVIGAGTENFSFIERFLSGSGDDTITWTAINGYVDAGGGDDTISTNGVIDGREYIGGLGTDTINFGGSNDIDINLSTGLVSRTGFSDDIITGFENATGNGGDNNITGTSAANILNGGFGDDTIDGGAGLDIVNGGDGNDIISGASFTDDQLNGDAGDDVFNLVYGDTVDGGTGIDTMNVYASAITVDMAAAEFYYMSVPSIVATFTNIEIFNTSTVSDVVTGVTSGVDINLLAGNDNLTMDGNAAAGANESYDGGAGVDTIIVNTNAGTTRTIDLDDGIYTDGAGDEATIINFENATGGAGNDIIVGTIGVNTLIGGAGNDSFDGLQGDDSFDGGAGTDTAIYAGIQANYTVTDTGGGTYTVTDNVGTAGTDTLDNIEFLQFSSGTVTVADAASGGGDINLTNSDDVYTATAADEVINALDGNDLVNAGGGNDTVNGGNGNDNLRGDAGDDYLDGGFGADILRGGAGADTLYGGAGTDVADYTTSGGAIGVTVNLTTNVNTGGDAQGDTIFFIDRVNGSTRADNITGNAAVNYLRGFAQDDTLIGLAGNDYLQGDAGADVLDGGAGTNDWAYYFSSPTGLTVNLGNTALNTGEAVGDTYIGIENLLGSQHDDFLYGDANNNFVRGVQGDDELYGGDGNDFLRGDQGADFHDGGNGVDWLYYATSSSAVTIDLGAGTASGGDAAGDTFANVERVYGSSFDDVITGDAGANYLRGSSGADTLIGGAGNDFLQGDSGADVLNGGAGSDWAYYASATTDVVIDLGTPANNTAEATGDSYISIENVVGGRFNDDITGDANDNTLRGFLGDDTLNGGGGDDILRGESGNDIFIFEVGGDNDVVIDWSDSDDMLDLSDFGFANNAAAMASAAQVGSDVVFTMGSDSITIEDTTLADITDNLIL